MFIAMNRFKVAKGRGPDFEALWLGRDTHLSGVPGFLEFRLLKGPEADAHTIYSSHTEWASHADFEAWTKSDAFRAAHRQAKPPEGLYLGPPVFEGFDVLQTLR